MCGARNQLEIRQNSCVSGGASVPAPPRLSPFLNRVGDVRSSAGGRVGAVDFGRRLFYEKPGGDDAHGPGFPFSFDR
jgi:hypothetical protein